MDLNELQHQRIREDLLSWGFKEGFPVVVSMNRSQPGQRKRAVKGYRLVKGYRKSDGKALR
jgi:hypothetical protein